MEGVFFRIYWQFFGDALCCPVNSFSAIMIRLISRRREVTGTKNFRCGQTTYRNRYYRSLCCTLLIYPNRLLENSLLL